MMSILKTIQAYLGWCPMAGSVRMDRAVRAGAVAAPGGQGGDAPELGWWNRYHNQLLVAALTASVATVAAFLLVGDTPGYPTGWTGLGFGAGWAIGFLFGHRKQYARIAAGEFIRENMTRRLRIVRDLSTPVAVVILIALVGYFVLNGMPDWIVWFMLALGIAFWAQYGITLLWERRHRTTLIAEKKSMYTLDTKAEGEPVWQ